MIKKLLGAFVLLLSIYYLSKQIGDNSHGLLVSLVDRDAITQTLFLLFIYIFTIVNCGAIWHILLSGFVGFKKSPVLSICILLVAQLAKYMPGNVGHHVGRLYLAKKYNYNLLQVFAAMTIENILPLICGGMLSVYVVYLLEIDNIRYFQYDLDKHILLFGLCVAFFLLVYIFLSRYKILKMLRNYVDPNIRMINIIYGLLLTLFNFFVLGFILCYLIKMHSPEATVDYLLITGIFSISWLLGFITPGSPGGIGVREALLVLFLTPLYGEAMSVWLSIVLRIITTMGDGIAFLIGLTLKPFATRSS